MSDARKYSTRGMTVHATVMGLAVVILAGTVQADGFRNPPGTAGALGDIGARYLTEDGPEAMSYNPANLSDTKKVESALSILYVDSQTDYSAPTGAKGSTDTDPALIPGAYIAWPINDKWVGGFGISSPFGQSTAWEKDGPFRYVAPYFAELRTINFNPTIATRINEQLAIGVGADIMWSDLDFRQSYPWVSVTQDPSDPDGTARIEGDGVGVGGNIGLTWTPKKGHEVAVTYLSAIEVDYEGDANFSSVPPAGKLPPPLGAIVTPRSDFDSNIEFPAIASVSYGHQCNEKLYVGVSVEWLQFSNYDTLPVDVGNNAPLLQVSEIPQDWDDTFTYGLGLDYAISEQLVARAGYIFLESPIPDETLAPTLPNNDQHTVTIGLGYTKDAHSFDLAYAYSFFEDRDIDNNQNPAFNGSYDTDYSHLVGFTYGYTY